ncbi:hypothetical protein HN51_004473 [Arachis hypogaea]|uniref:Uncharacterized protein n=1 Tax=Arachis hypogaea TaxID=3818 RepID=A0A445DID7_ARAHY|nr:uncharacterized protein LOC112794733 [Arachis hypogaea]RYR62955.1 hypothetical protein Ahy_A04g020716 [Arachis hypogaea]
MASLQAGVEITNKKDENNLQREKQIVVDPLSLRESSTILTSTILHPPPLHSPNPRFLSLSLPNSASSSPRFTPRKISKGESNGSQEQEQAQLRKSKSCDETRSLAPSSYELDHHHWLTKLSEMEEHHHNETFSEVVKRSPKSVKKKQVSDDGFRCSSLCLYLPGFGAKLLKPCKARKEEEDGSESKSQSGAMNMSRTVSVQEFECGSWASGVAKVPEVRTHSRSSYFDLPIELINGNDVNSPFSGASSFAFEKELKGVLKNGSSRGGSGRKSDGSPRHVRFSLSPSPESSCPASPAFCISPRLRKAREDFNAFLAAAQTA